MIFLVRVIQRGNVVTDRDWSFDNPTETHDWSQFDTDNDFCSAFQSLSLTTLHEWWLTIKQQDQLFLPGSNLSRYFLFLFSSSMYKKSSAVFRWNVGKSNQWYRIWQQNSHSCCGHKIRGDLSWNYNSPCNLFLWALEERIWCVIRITPSSWLNYLLSWPLCRRRWEYFVWPLKNL